LVLIERPPARIFQMLAHIDGRMADIMFVETEVADRVLELQDPVPAGAFEGLFLLKIPGAQILYDASDRLKRAQQKVRREELANWLQPASYSALYTAWFWQNHGLFHMKRMVQSTDPVYLTAVDMMLANGLSGLGRAYFTIRNLPWEGEKAAVRYLQEHDPGFLARLRECFTEPARDRKLGLYEALVERALAPAGALWTPGLAAVTLREPDQQAAHLEMALQFWEDLMRQT
jgi:hypothetical protein